VPDHREHVFDLAGLCGWAPTDGPNGGLADSLDEAKAAFRDGLGASAFFGKMAD
jgi:hypothetical protein